MDGLGFVGWNVRLPMRGPCRDGKRVGVSASAGSVEDVVNPFLRGKTVLVTGATGPTGQLVCGLLAQHEVRVVALVRPNTFHESKDRVQGFLDRAPKAEVLLGDLRDKHTIQNMVREVDAVIWAAGTRNFEKTDPNRPSVVDNDCVAQAADSFLDAQLVKDLKEALLEHNVEDEHSRFVLISSLGVTRPEKFPMLTSMGDILKNKYAGELALKDSGVPYTIIRPGGFLEESVSSSHGVLIDQGDRLEGFIGRKAVAELAVQSLFRVTAANTTFECIEDPTTNYPSSYEEWSNLFRGLVEDGSEVAASASVSV